MPGQEDNPVKEEEIVGGKVATKILSVGITDNKKKLSGQNNEKFTTGCEKSLTSAGTRIDAETKKKAAAAASPAIGVTKSGAAATDATDTSSKKGGTKIYAEEKSSSSSSSSSKRALAYAMDTTTVSTDGVSKRAMAYAMTDSFNSPPEPMPVPMPSRPSQPGAFSGRGSERTPGVMTDQSSRNDGRATSLLRDSKAEDSETELTGSVRSSMLLGLDDNSSLAVADLVVDEGPNEGDLPQAQEFDEEAAMETKQQKTKEGNARLMERGFFLVTILVLLVVIIVQSQTKKVGGGGGGGGGGQEAITMASAETTSPTMAPTSQKSYLLDNLPEYTLVEILHDPKSSQSKAMEWMLEDTNLASYTSIRIIQRFSLATLYYATNGDEWSNNDNWLDHDIHECEWHNKGEFGYKTETSKSYPGYFAKYNPDPTICGEDGLYRNLWLDKNNLVGSLPLELWLLTSLQSLSLSQNFISGEFPTHVGQLTSLTGFAVMHSEMEGTVPTEFGLLSELRVLDVTNNNHNGFIPTELWQLTKIQYLNLSQNKRLQGSLPTQLGTFCNLTWILGNDSSLTGTLPTELGQLEHLEWIVLLESRFSGTIPTEFGNLSSLLLLSIFGNLLTGSLPTELAQLSTMFLMTLRDNQLTGPIPSQFGQLTRLVATLNLRNNLLSGAMPSQLGLLTNLQELELRKNRLTGQIPSELGQLASADLLTFANNSLAGTIPEELSGLSLLQTIMLEGNSLLSGNIPPTLCGLSGNCVGGNALDWCEDASSGLSFDCTDQLCGCNCSSCI